MNTEILIAPLEYLLPLPATLDGSAGTNRLQGQRQIDANDDISAIKAWLDEFVPQSPTWRAYRKEAERLLLWAVIERAIPLSSLTRDDFDRYEAFLDNPPTDWRASRSVRRDDPAWRPFEGPLAPASKRHALVALNALFSWLVVARYLSGNPLALFRGKGRLAAASTVRKTRRETQSILEKRQMITRFLPRETFDWLLAYLNQLPDTNQREIARKERAMFAIPFLQQTGLRLSEFCMAQMGDVRKDRNGWWIHILGKGTRIDQVPLPEEALSALIRYRLHWGLSPLPRHGDSEPLIFRLHSTEPLEPGSFYEWLKALFAEAGLAAHLANQTEHASILNQASTHWLRHTAFSHQADAGLDLRVIQANARHKSIATTSLYLHAGDAEQHFQTTAKHRLTGDAEEEDEK